MHDLLEDLRGLTEPFALATVVRTWRSAPRGPGASMAVTAAGAAVGSVSGGCVEGAVYDVCQDVLATGRARLVSYGVTDDDAFQVGLTCGGTIELLVRRVDPAAGADLADVLAAVDGRRPAALATVAAAPDPGLVGRGLFLTGEDVRGTTGDADADAAALRAGQAALTSGRTGVTDLDGMSVFVEPFVPPARMIIFGANDFAAALAQTGAFLGYRVIVCDARPVFATRERLPHADEVHVLWPHEYLRSIDVDAATVLCVLTHDPKFDIPLLETALGTPAGYIGVMGSRRTHADRHAQLLRRGVPPEQLDRLRSPIGLDLGARTPQETAVSIAAEIIAGRWGGTGRPLVSGTAPIHHDVPALTALEAPVPDTCSVL